MWVLNEEVQIDSNGCIIPPGTTPYFWIGDICKKRIKPDKTTGQFQIADPRKRSIALPNLNDQALVQLLFAMRKTYASNFAGALLALQTLH